MILNVFFRDEWRYAETWQDMGAIVMSVLNTMKAGSEIASLGFSEQRHTGHNGPANTLRIAVNRETGYGGLVWFLERNNSKHGGIYDHVWVSDNPEPPVEDPRVASDPWTPVYLDRKSTLPIPKIRAAIEEYCKAGTGDRPETIDWVHGHVNGRRLGIEGDQ